MMSIKTKLPFLQGPFNKQPLPCGIIRKNAGLAKFNLH